MIGQSERTTPSSDRNSETSFFLGTTEEKSIRIRRQRGIFGFVSLAFRVGVQFTACLLQVEQPKSGCSQAANGVLPGFLAVLVGISIGDAKTLAIFGEFWKNPRLDGSKSRLYCVKHRKMKSASG